MTITIIPPGTETDEQYHRSGCWGSTLLNTFIRSPALAHRIITGTWRQPETPALRFGRLFHHRMDRTFAFDRHYRVAPDVDKRTKAWAAAEEQAKADGVVLISLEDHQQVEAMKSSVLANPVAASLLEGAEHEVGFRGLVGQIPVQCRADILHRWSHIADLKTTVDVDDFGKSVGSYGYHVQAAFYRWLISQACNGELLPFSFIVVEKQAPLYRCRIFDLDDQYLDLGRQAVEAALDDIARRTETGDWDDHRDAEMVSPPAWMIAQGSRTIAA